MSTDSPTFAVSLSDADSVSSEALIGVLEDENNQRSIVAVETIEAAIDSEAEVIILQAIRDQEVSDEILERLKNRKVIGIGHGAAQLFRHLGLEINDGVCMHDPDGLPTISLVKNTLVSDSGSSEPMVAFELSSSEQHEDCNFAMYIPNKSELGLSI